MLPLAHNAAGISRCVLPMAHKAAGNSRPNSPWRSVLATSERSVGRNVRHQVLYQVSDIRHGCFFVRFTWMIALRAAGFATASLVGRQKRVHGNVLLCWYRGSLIREIGRHITSKVVQCCLNPGRCALRAFERCPFAAVGRAQKYAPTLARSHVQCWSRHGVAAVLCTDTTATRL